MKLKFSWQIFEKHSQISNFINIHPVVHADERTDITKLIVDFRNFANKPKKTATTTHELSTF